MKRIARNAVEECMAERRLRDRSTIKNRIRRIFLNIFTSR